MDNLYQVHMLPTDKANGGLQLVHSIKDKQLSLADFGTYIDTRIFKSQHLYITSNEEIKEGDWVIDTVERYIRQAIKSDLEYFNAVLTGLNSGHLRLKIIATTNPELWTEEYVVAGDIDDLINIPKIDLPFIEAYIKAYNTKKPIKEVKLEIQNAVLAGSSSEYSFNDSIIPVQVLKLTPEGAVIPIQSPIKEKKFTRDEVEGVCVLWTRHFMDTFIHKLVLKNEDKKSEDVFTEWFDKTYPE